jgi:hypothetical protein
VVEECAIQRGLDGRVRGAIAGPKVRGHGALLGGERLDERREGRPVQIEGRQPIADQVGVTRGALAA